jgi:hypothetical protein
MIIRCSSALFAALVLSGCGLADTAATGATGAAAEAQQASQAKQTEDRVRDQAQAAVQQDADRRKAAEDGADH